MRSELLMRELLRIMANLMRPDLLGPAEVAYAGMLQAADVVRQVRHLRAALA